MAAAWEAGFQDIIYLLTLFLAGGTAILGYRAVHHLWKQKEKLQLTKTALVAFTLITAGYILFALGELSWYLIYGFIQRLPLASVPDMYWFLGGLSLLIGFILFSSHFYKNHGQLGQGVALKFFVAAIAAGVLYYVLSLGVVKEGTAFAVFLGYYYPIVSALVLIASTSIYLFYEKIGSGLGSSLLLLAVANLGFFLADILFTYYSFRNIYGMIGVISDLLYALAYVLLIVAFWTLGQKIKDVEEG